MLIVITRKITAFILVVILFAHNINTLVIIGDFLANQAIIAKTLCVQKEAQKGCNGKCQLTKELAQNNTESNSDAPAQERERLVLDAFCLSAFDAFEFQCVNSNFKKQNTTIRTPKLTHMYLDIDTPPPNEI